MITGETASSFDAWLRRQINRSDHVGNLGFEASRDPDWPQGASGPAALKHYLLEERDIYGQKIYVAVNEAWRQFDKEEVTEWNSPGGWLYEMALQDDLLSCVKRAMEAHGIDDPGLMGFGPDGEVVVSDW